MDMAAITGYEEAMEKFFKLKEKGTDVKTEILAGLTTFLTILSFAETFSTIITKTK